MAPKSKNKNNISFPGLCYKIFKENIIEGASKEDLQKLNTKRLANKDDGRLMIFTLGGFLVVLFKSASEACF